MKSGTGVFADRVNYCGCKGAISRRLQVGEVAV
jgi:hypothetical protein